MRKVIYVTICEDCDGSENLLAWASLDSADAGRVGVYRLVEEINVREVKEIKRKGSKKWFKPELEDR